MTAMMSLGERMKYFYEGRFQTELMRRTPAILRLDGRAFHTLTKKLPCEKPFDVRFNDCMCIAASALVAEVQGAALAYVQSDEISILINDYKKFTTEAWFDYNVQKLTSVSAAIATAHFNKALALNWESANNLVATFDARVFNIPREEATNYFIWRQQDCMRNSVQALGQSHFSQSQLQNRTCEEIKGMLLAQKDVNWNALHEKWRNGSLIRPNYTSFAHPLFQYAPVCIEDCLKQEEE